jgi:hypothetical protein
MLESTMLDSALLKRQITEVGAPIKPSVTSPLSSTSPITSLISAAPAPITTLNPHVVSAAEAQPDSLTLNPGAISATVISSLCAFTLLATAIYLVHWKLKKRRTQERAEYRVRTNSVISLHGRLSVVPRSNLQKHRAVSFVEVPVEAPVMKDNAVYKIPDWRRRKGVVELLPQEKLPLQQVENSNHSEGSRKDSGASRKDSGADKFCVGGEDEEASIGKALTTNKPVSPLSMAQDGSRHQESGEVKLSLVSPLWKAQDGPRHPEIDGSTSGG